MRQSTTAVLWGVFTVTAVATGLGAVGVIRDSVTTPSAAPLSQQEVAADLAAAPPATIVTTSSARPIPTDSKTTSATPTHSQKPSATHSSSPRPSQSTSASPTVSVRPSTRSPSATAVTRSVGSRGGSVVATCTSGLVYLKSWSPASGFRVDEVQRGPARDVEIRFDSASQEIKLRVACVGGVPTGSVETSGGASGDSESVDSGD